VGGEAAAGAVAAGEAAAGAVAAGGSADTGSGAAAAADSGGGEPSIPEPLTPPFPCLNPQPYGNEGSGFELCNNGMLHRLNVGECLPGGNCQVDEDCPPTATDEGTICRCSASGGQCVAARCATDDDCEAGSACVGTPNECYFIPEAIIFACQTADDTCGGCNSGVTDECVQLDAGFRCRECHGTGGRPFLVGDLPRTATTVPSSAWHDCRITLAAPVLTAELRACVSAHWLKQAEMEHASVAAFARFVLELLSLGAPPDLVSAATSALADETRHARSCYALASSYAQQPLGPGQLDVSGALAELGLESIMTRAVLEGCVGETLAAIEASEAASLATDGTIRQVLSGIAEDEGRHAELSWRFLRWALRKSDGSLGEAVRRAFAQARLDLIRRRETSSPSALDAELLRHGVLSGYRSAGLALEAFDAVVVPCAVALLAELPISAPSWTQVQSTSCAV
jgi:hypothetical protein